MGLVSHQPATVYSDRKEMFAAKNNITPRNNDDNSTGVQQLGRAGGREERFMIQSFVTRPHRRHGFDDISPEALHPCAPRLHGVMASRSPSPREPDNCVF